MIEGIKHIIFDLGNVLLNIEPTKTYEALAQLGIPDFESAYQSLHAQGLFQQYEMGQLSSAQFIASLKALCPEPTTEEQIVSAWNALLLDFPLRRLQILQQLQLHYDLILLSNTNELHETSFNKQLHQAHGLPNIGVFFDKVYYSHRLGMRKPDPAIYQKILDDCSFAPEKTLFIDDLEDNTKAAAALGIQCIWLQAGMSIEKDIFLSVTK